MKINIPQNEQFLRIASVIILTGLPRTSIYEGMREGTFPRPVLIGTRAVAWPAATIKAWQDGCIAAAAARIAS